MKTSKNIFKSIFFFLIIAIAGLNPIAAQDSKKDKEAKKAASIKKIVEEQQYVFKAETVIPANGRTRHLTSEYDLKVSKDTIASYLPYFGRAYTGPIDPTQGGIKFTSTNFQYIVENAKKGGWNIRIKPKDATDIQQLLLNIYANGNASLQVTSTNRQPISFHGYIADSRK